MYLLNKKKAQLFHKSKKEKIKISAVEKSSLKFPPPEDSTELKLVVKPETNAAQSQPQPEEDNSIRFAEPIDPNSTSHSTISQQETPIDQSNTTTDTVTTKGEEISLEISHEQESNNEEEEEEESNEKTWVTSSNVDFTEEIFSDWKFKIFSYLVSYKFIAIVYTISVILHLSIWAVLGGIDELSYKNTGKRIFLWNVSPFAFDTGCVTTSNTVFLVGAEAAVYIIVEVSFLIILFFVDRDTWSIKIEAFVLVVIQVILSISYIISGQIEVIRFLTDYFVPFGFTLLTYSLLEVIISVILPVIYAIRHDSHQAEYASTELELFLKNRKTFAILLDFATRSYCNEDVLAFRDIENFRKSPKQRNKKIVAMKILKTYLKRGSPLELNIQNIDRIYWTIHNEILTATDDSLIASTLFDDVRYVCLNNMTDLFERLKSSNKAVRETVENWKRANKILEN